jgi:hypothetical protein
MTIDDRFLYELRRDPPAGLAEQVRARLDMNPQAPALTGRRWLPSRIASWTAAAIAAALLFTLPAVRASAQAFLDLFRVVNFVAVPVRSERIAQLTQLDLPHLIGDQIAVLKPSGPPLAVSSLDAAGAAAGISVRIPAELPANTTVRNIEVIGDHAMRINADTAKLRRVLDTLQIEDIEIPADLDGQTADVRVPPVVLINYEQGVLSATLSQARTPIVTLPRGVDLATLGEIALRVLGVAAHEAHRVAAAIDWHSTLLVPIPPDAASFRQVDVSGAQGIAIEGPVRTIDGRRQRMSQIAWSTGDRVFAMRGTLSLRELLVMANSVR